jgi:hypothetical protein
MTETPKTLRELIINITDPKQEIGRAAGLAHADAWEADQLSLSLMDGTATRLAKRLEAAEKRRLVVERRLVYLDWDGDWDGLEGYVQVMLNQDAAAAQPNDETCSCGHLLTSHNEHGCCWDDDCGCDKPRRAALAGEEK